MIHMPYESIEPAVLQLAMLRYPKEPALLALEFFLRDRRTAGHGAMKDQRQPIERGRFVVRRKYRYTIDHKVTYLVARSTFEEYEPPSIEDPVTIHSTMTIRRVPAYEYMIDFHARDFNSARGRREIAHRLRAMRAEIRRLHPEQSP